MSKIKTMVDLDDFVRGSTLYGTGGGGSQVMGKALLEDSLKDELDIHWYPLSDFNDEDWLCTAFYMGSIAPPTEQDELDKKKKGMVEKKEARVLIRAVKELEKELGISFTGIIPVELGGINSPAPVDAATRMDKKVVDGDLAGRAVPEIAQTMPRVEGMEICPISCCDAWGNVVIIKETHGYDMAESLGKMLSIPAYEPIGLACFAMQAKEAEKVVVKGTMTRNLEVGKAVRIAKERGEDPASIFAKISDGEVGFRGVVTNFEWKNEGGYMVGETIIKDEEKELKIWFKNENHISWLDGKVWVTSPDLIQIVHEETGEPITNTDLKEGMKVAVVIIANKKYYGEKGVEILGPKHFGFEDIVFKPMKTVE